MQTLEETLMAVAKGRRETAFQKYNEAKTRWEEACSWVSAIEQVIEFNSKEKEKTLAHPPVYKGPGT